LVLDGDTGLLCEPGDDEALARALLGVLDDAKLGDHLTQGARGHLERNFTVDRMAAHYLELYKEQIRAAAPNLSRK
jgi:glycosyltransferase involved in cell wall biosynthesis